MKPKICLGTAQFGLTYGITNKSGQVSRHEVQKILRKGVELGVKYLDTARAYGSAEEVIGSCLKGSNEYKIISKLPGGKNNNWEYHFQKSCNSLKVKSIDSILLHSADDLKGRGGQALQDWLLSLKERGLVKRIGVSIYEKSDLIGINKEVLDLVQLPLSIYDQRMLKDGTIKELKSGGIAIHARSLYLQGLLLTPAENWPTWIEPPIRNHHRSLQKVALEKQCRLIDLALGFAKEQSHLEAVVLGLCNVYELYQLNDAWETKSPWQEGEWSSWSITDSCILDPRRWPR